MTDLIEILEAPDPTIRLDELSRFDETQTVAALRREHRDHPLWQDALRETALHLLDRHGLNSFARATGTAALLDVGEHREAVVHLGQAFARDIATDADIRVLARVYREHRRPTVAQRLHQIADEVARQGRWVPTHLAHAIANAMQRQTALPEPTPKAIEEKAVTGIKVLHQPTPIPGEPGVVLRPLLSRQQVGRAAHALRNCSGDLFRQIRAGLISLYVLDVDGVPTEMIEIFLDDGCIGRWLGHSNRPPDEIRKRRIAKWIFAEQLAVAE